MKWFADDFNAIVRKNKKQYPLYSFLSFLMDGQEKEKVTVRTEGNRWNGSIDRVTFQFDSLEPQTFDFTELSADEYVDFLNFPKDLLRHFENDPKLKKARSFYERAQQAHETVQDMRYDLITNNGMKYPAAQRTEAFMSIGEVSRLGNQAIDQGATFCKRLEKLYQLYVKAAKPNLASKSVPVSKQAELPNAEDYIEAELLKILKDPDISESTKSKAKDTLDGYRQQKEEVPIPNPKEEDALISIQTIQEHYMKGVKPV